MFRTLSCLVLLAAAFTGRPAVAQVLPAPWVDLGFAEAGSFGNPNLVPKGTLEATSALDLLLTQCLPNQKAYLVVGTSTIYAPYKGGTLVPFPNLLFIYPTSATGSVHILVHWPPAVPPGVPFIMQFWIDDPQAIAGRAGSNAIGALTP